MTDSTGSRRSALAAAVVDYLPDWAAMTATKALGGLAKLPVPSTVSKAVVKGYCRSFGVDLSEVDQGELQSGYRKFDDFFTRKLNDDARPVESAPGVVVSPSDGYLREISRITADSRVVAKDHSYSISALLADNGYAKEFEGGHAAVVYLHPRDYHRVHSPVAGTVVSATNVPGRLLPVTTASLRRQPELFALNERLVHRIESENGPVAVVMVAAFGVGHMSCAYLDMPIHPQRVTQVNCEPAVNCNAGDELGTFHLGSTVVLLFGKGQLTALREQGPIRMGQALARWNPA